MLIHYQLFYAFNYQIPFASSKIPLHKPSHAFLMNAGRKIYHILLNIQLADLYFPHLHKCFDSIILNFFL